MSSKIDENQDYYRFKSIKRKIVNYFDIRLTWHCSKCLADGVNGGIHSVEAPIKEKQEYNFHILIAKNCTKIMDILKYKYYDSPEGQDCLGKMVYMSKWAAYFGKCNRGLHSVGII